MMGLYLDDYKPIMCLSLKTEALLTVALTAYILKAKQSLT